MSAWRVRESNVCIWDQPAVRARLRSFVDLPEGQGLARRRHSALPQITRSVTEPDMEKLVPLDTKIVPEAAVSGAVALATESDTMLSFNASDGSQYGCAIVRFKHSNIHKFGYPNDEAWSGIPRTRGGTNTANKRQSPAEVASGRLALERDTRIGA
jgi:hypothetical protein